MSLALLLYKNLFAALVLLVVFILYIFFSLYLKPSIIYKDNLEIPKFYSDVRFDPYPDTINVENEFDCNINSLKICKLDDPTTIFGCKELAVRCHHFDEEITHFVNGEKITVPKNESPDEGYALAITTLVDSCNPYHGDLVLVSVDSSSKEYLLICLCKNPGYIGNSHLLGSCETVHICDGKIKSINVPIEQMVCECQDAEQNIFYQGSVGENPIKVPACHQLNVKEANELYKDWTHLVAENLKGRDSLNIDYFNHTIKFNTNVQYLLHPCKYALENPAKSIPNSDFNLDLGSCVYLDSGLPVRTNLLKTDQNKNKDYDWIIPFDGALSSFTHHKIRFIDDINKTRRIVNLQLEFELWSKNFKRTIINVILDDVAVHTNGQLAVKCFEQINGGKCSTNMFQVSCSIANNFDKMNGLFPVGAYHDLPWVDREYWRHSEGAVSLGVKFHSNHISLNNRYLDIDSRWRYYGMQYCNRNTAHADHCLNGMLTMSKVSDYNKHKRLIGGKED